MYRSGRLLVCAVLLAVCGRARAQVGDDAPLKRQLPEDQVAYKAAEAVSDPAQRLRAMRMFAVAHQDSKWFDRANEETLRILLKFFPARVSDIRDQVKVNLENADAGFDRWQEEATEAEMLADAGSAALLPLAQKLAEDANRNLTEDSYGAAMFKLFGEMEMPMPNPASLHDSYREAHAQTVVALAHVYLQQGKQARCEQLLDGAQTLQPLSAQVHALRGQMAAAAHHDAEALDLLEQAQLLGELTPRQHALLLTLYRAAHGGSDAGLEAELDSRYATVYPPPFTPAPHPPVQAGHTALLELFTGSSCAPCVGADIAVEAILQQYTRDQVVVLEFDEHVPAPDPLANPASVARGDLFEVGTTPNYVLDGKRIPLYGAPRAASEDVYKHLLRPLDVQLARPSGVALTLSATRDAAGIIHATAVVQAQAGDTLHDRTAAEIAAWPGDPLTMAVRAKAQANLPPSLALVFALVEDNVRYSGENGIRFHRMVVRGLSSDAAGGEPIHPGETVTHTAAFNPTVISHSLSDYLTRYERSNDRFGPVKFLSKDTAMEPGHLAVAAWVQDTVTHRVLQAAFVTVPAAPGGAVAER